MSTKTTNRKTVTVRLDEIDVNWVSVDSLIKNLERIKAENTDLTNFYVDWDTRWYDGSKYYYVEADRLETDEEYNARTEDNMT